MSQFKKPKLPKLDITFERCAEFVVMVCREVDKAFGPDEKPLEYMRAALHRYEGVYDTITYDMVNTMIVAGEHRTAAKNLRITPSYIRAADALAEDLLSIHSHMYSADSTKLSKPELSDMVRRVRDNAEAIGLPDMTVIQGFFTLLFR